MTNDINTANRGRVMDDRIKLAEAMGESTLITRFDPFTSADDDYAVLEWMRRQDNFLRFAFRIDSGDVGSNYQIGDYAHAALKVLSTKEKP